jgi:hypothetical protein
VLRNLVDTRPGTARPEVWVCEDDPEDEALGSIGGLPDIRLAGWLRTRRNYLTLEYVTTPRGRKEDHE